MALAFHPRHTFTLSTTSSVRSGFRIRPIQSFYVWYQSTGQRLAEELRRQVGEVVPPVAPEVTLFGGYEGVLDVVFGHQVVERLGSRKEAVGFAAGNVCLLYTSDAADDLLCVD